jgi:hypothetical protein
MWTLPPNNLLEQQQQDNFHRNFHSNNNSHDNEQPKPKQQQQEMQEMELEEQIHPPHSVTFSNNVTDGTTTLSCR